jgi:quercetin dioxygenase-like cupin family protein
MRSFDNRASAQTSVQGVRVARWDQYALDDTLPFEAMWYSVPPGHSSPRDCHVEAELSVVLSGTAWVETSGGIVRVEAGSAFLLDSDEAHVVHNRSEDQILLVFSAYWVPAAAKLIGARSA